MVLHTDSVDGSSLLQLALNLHEITLVYAIALSPKIRLLVDAKLICGKIFSSRSEAIFNEIRLVEQCRAFRPPPSLVCDLDSSYLVRIALGDLAATALILALALLNRLVPKPLREEMIVCQSVLTGLDSVLFAEFKAGINRRSAVKRRAVLCVAQMTSFRLGAVPIKRQSCHVEEISEIFLIETVLLLGLKLPQHEAIGAKAELVILLNRLDLAVNRVSVLILQRNCSKAFTVCLNSRRNSVLGLLVVLFKQFKNVVFHFFFLLVLNFCKLLCYISEHIDHGFHGLCANELVLSVEVLATR